MQVQPFSVNDGDGIRTTIFMAGCPLHCQWCSNPRHSFSIALTEEGMLLRKRAEDLLSMADKITEEFSAMDDIIGGNIYFGCAESYQIRYLARVIQRFKRKYPMFHYHITSGDTEQVTEKLDKGLLDFAIIVEEPDAKKYQILQMPGPQRRGWRLSRNR